MAYQSSTEVTEVRGPACMHLLSKGMYVSGQRDPADDPLGPMGDGHCWCAKTQRAYGPDDQQAERKLCSPGRGCFESIV